MASLAHRTYGHGGRVAILAHGILGSGRNWSTFATQLARELPDWRFVVVDLRNHGDSHGFPGPHDLAACAEDLAALRLEPEALIGHSFGGKVVQAFARDFGAPVTWVLDALPGPVHGHSEVSGVLAAVEAVPQPLASREALAEHLQGLPGSIVRWMGTNLRRGPAGGLVWRFALPQVHEMLRSYADTDFWPLVESGHAELHFVRGGRSQRWTEQALARFSALPRWSPVRLSTLPDAGHWLHVDDPEGLRALLRAGLG